MKTGYKFKKPTGGKLTSNEESVFQEWRKSLPLNLQTDNETYDLRSAWKGGLEPEFIEGEWHLGSRNPETGQLLKSPNHPTYDKMITGEIQAGYTPSIDIKTGEMKSFKYGGNMKKLKKCDTGGDIEQMLPLLSTALGAVNPALGVAANIGIQGLSNMKNEAPVIPDTTYNSNPYGKMKYGGIIPSGFTQHDAPSHDNGGQSVDAQGKPNMVAPVAEIQNNENVFNNYVYSDMLTNPKTGRTFNIDMQKLAKKYKNADTDLLSKTALNISADNLAKTNDLVRTVTEQAQTASEQLPQAPYGIDLEPLPTLPINIVPGQVGVPSVPQEQNMNLPHIQNPFETMAGQDVQDPFDTYTKAPTYINKVMSNRFSSNAPVQASTFADAPVDYSGVTGTDDKSGIQDRGFNYNTAALVAKGLGLGDSAFRALRPAEVESPILPDYQSANAMMDRASIDLTSSRQNSMGVSNILGNMNRSTSSGFGQYRNREAARIAGLQDNIADITSQERTANSQLDMNRAGAKTNMANATAGALYQNRVDNQQNAAARDAFGSQFASELTQIGSSLNQYSNFQTELANRKDIASLNAQQVVALAKAKGLNFTLGEAEEFLNAVKSGQNPIKFTK